MSSPSKRGKDPCQQSRQQKKQQLRVITGSQAALGFLFFIPSFSNTCTPSAYSARILALALTHSSCPP